MTIIISQIELVNADPLRFRPFGPDALRRLAESKGLDTARPFASAYDLMTGLTVFIQEDDDAQ